MHFGSGYRLSIFELLRGRDPYRPSDDLRALSRVWTWQGFWLASVSQYVDELLLQGG